MERIGEEQKVSLQFVADVLGVTPEAIRKHVREIYPEIIKNGIKTELTEKQVTEIKKRMIPTTLVEGALTSLDIEEMTIKVLQYHTAKIQELKAENEKQQEQLKIAEPKAKNWDDIASHETFMNFRDAAGKMGLQQKDLMTLLKTKYIYKNTRGEYRAFSEYQQYFSLRPYTNGDYLGSQLMLTADGYLYFNKKVNG
jgi:hypothetical protein